ncbi:hypothetical protein ACFSR7_06025 [Cohnella sp. GCM10020058]|uniref:hypothetical protein n=1 Tax=Cohnella sp. GCM10020058 TaxID=3317330 RepID=UPI00363339C7
MASGSAAINNQAPATLLPLGPRGELLQLKSAGRCIRINSYRRQAPATSRPGVRA